MKKVPYRDGVTYRMMVSRGDVIKVIPFKRPKGQYCSHLLVIDEVNKTVLSNYDRVSGIPCTAAAKPHNESKRGIMAGDILSRAWEDVNYEL